MEQSQFVDATLRIYRRLREAGSINVGTVLQSLPLPDARRPRSLLPLAPNLRLVKGAYLEPAELAYPARPTSTRLTSGCSSGCSPRAGTPASQRMTSADRARDPVRGGAEISGERFEFQMLYGVRPQLQLDLVRRGYKVLVATPYGPDGTRTLMRRLGERPANLLFFLKNTRRG